MDVTVEYVAGDTASRIVVQAIDDETDAVIPCSAFASGKLRLSINGAAYADKTLAVLDDVTGKWVYRFLNTDLVAGKSIAQAEWTEVGGYKVTSLDEIHITVREKR